LLLDKLSSTLTQAFNEVFALFKTMHKISMTNLEERHLGEKPPLLDGNDMAKQLEELLAMAQQQYLELSAMQDWNGVGHVGHSSFLANEFGWNCGKEGHKAKQCLGLRDPVQYKKNHKLDMEKKQSAGRGGPGRGRGRGRGRHG